ncbi:alpha/beta fold hydrolase [Sphingobium chlorophenolicum]|uniref:Esterase EstC n=1 Tax=Sphingobium chlorophenolicum TaxID=46429 RepID=A0A081RA98_SPHCR|nr:alpha/beta fold hydrolase [Sphingobium chlorophenolicum]KEQ52121.1 Esterase EstC [Sphingobium chlorophenolicum]
MQQYPPIILVHGAWHGAWCWNRTQFDLALLNRSSIAVDLLNHGLRALFPKAQRARPFAAEAMVSEPSPAAAISLGDAASHLAEQIRTLSLAAGCRVALVAHSLGGAIANAAAEMAAEHISHLVHICAITPVDGHTALEYRMSPENEGSRTSLLQTGSPPEIGAARIDAADESILQDIRDIFFHDIDEAAARAAAHFMTPDVPVKFLRDPVVTTERFGGIARAYIICTQDNALLEAAQRRCISDMDRAYPDMPTKVSTLASSHSPFFSCPEQLAFLIDLHSKEAG